MFKKILYIIIILVIIIILAIMWKDSNKVESPSTNSNTEQVEQNGNVMTEINNIDVDSGIDADLQQIDNEIKTL